MKRAGVKSISGLLRARQWVIHAAEVQIRSRQNLKPTQAKYTADLHVDKGKIKVIGKARSKTPGGKNTRKNKGWDAQHEGHNTIW